MNLVLKVKRHKKDPQATYSECDLWKVTVTDAGEHRTCVYRHSGIENTHFLMAAGTYVARRTKSPRFSKAATEKARLKDPDAPEVEVWTWEIFGVLDGTRKRAGLRIHPVNFSRDLLGCLAFGLELKDLDGDDVIDLARSKDAHRIFDQACRDEKIMQVVITDP